MANGWTIHNERLCSNILFHSVQLKFNKQSIQYIWIQLQYHLKMKNKQQKGLLQLLPFNIMSFSEGNNEHVFCVLPKQWLLYLFIFFFEKSKNFLLWNAKTFDGKRKGRENRRNNKKKNKVLCDNGNLQNSSWIDKLHYDCLNYSEQRKY